MKIFAYMRPEVSLTKLILGQKKWLLRESSIDGFVSIDYLNQDGFHHARFGLLYTEGRFTWNFCNSKEDLKKAQSMLKKIGVSNIDAEEIRQQIYQLMELIEKTYHLSITSQLDPSIQELSTSKLYAIYATMGTTISKPTSVARGEFGSVPEEPTRCVAWEEPGIRHSVDIEQPFQFMGNREPARGFLPQLSNLPKRTFLPEIDMPVVTGEMLEQLQRCSIKNSNGNF